MSQTNNHNGPDSSIAVFIDFENFALGFEHSRKKFEIQKVLERLLEKGKIIVKRAYADWTRYRDYKQALHEAAIELIEVPKRGTAGKNSADIRMCVDAIDMAHSKGHIDTFAILTGDSDFSPLVSKLKENGKRVIGLGMKDSTSMLLVDNCDEFIYYEDLERSATTAAPEIKDDLPKLKKEAFQMIVDTILALKRENRDTLYSSMIKDTLKRKKPQFDESYHGYRTWQDLLEDMERNGIIQLTTDPRSGTFVVTGFGKKK
ncbi:MAG TPA: NYN domain-containing protein [Planctomycetota bacterium]|nr:NYN domain-containing protein [Planctomycetota bacterium]